MVVTVPTHRYLTLREWGARQDPAMSVEEVVAAKMADTWQNKSSPPSGCGGGRTRQVFARVTDT